MALQTSGPISLADIAAEFGGTAPHSLSEYYAGGGLVPAGTAGINGPIPSSGAISFSQFYGAANLVFGFGPTTNFNGKEDTSGRANVKFFADGRVIFYGGNSPETPLAGIASEGGQPAAQPTYWFQGQTAPEGSTVQLSVSAVNAASATISVFEGNSPNSPIGFVSATQGSVNTGTFAVPPSGLIFRFVQALGQNDITYTGSFTVSATGFAPSTATIDTISVLGT